MDTFRSVMSSVKDIDLSGSAQFRLKEDEIIKIWHEISSHIDQLMIQSKGVIIPGLGTFTFYQQKIQVGHQEFLLIQRPIFVIAEKFAMTHQIKYTKIPVEGKIPVQHINYTYIHKQTGYNRDHLQLVVKHVVQTFSRDLMNNKMAECVFDGIGILRIKKQQVEMKFLKEFIEDLEAAQKAILTPKSYIEESLKNLCRPKKFQDENEVNETSTKLDLTNLVNSSESELELKLTRMNCNETSPNSNYKEDTTLKTDRSTRWKCTTENKIEFVGHLTPRKPLNKIDRKVISRLNKPKNNIISVNDKNKGETHVKNDLTMSRGTCLLDRMEKHDQTLNCTHRSVI